MYIHQLKQWPNFIWDASTLAVLLSEVHLKQGKLLGQMEKLGFDLQNEALLQTLTNDVIKTSEIEGEKLDNGQVRSSIARRLGIEIGGLVQSDRDVDGIVEMMLDATQNYDAELTADRLFGWHACLFPGGRSGMIKIVVGRWRENEKNDPMQVVSGAMGKEKVHYQAPDSVLLANEMQQFIDWFNNEMNLDPIIKAGISHLWFLTIHPFDDGNGRISRAIADMQLARADQTARRFYSMSAQIRLERKKYYDILEKTQSGNLDITLWLSWFLSCLNSAIDATAITLNSVILKSKILGKVEADTFNQRQKLMLSKFLDGFEGKLTSSKWAKITKCSQDTATRDIQDLVNKGILVKDLAGGRSTNYLLVH
ncbi:Fic family protein [Pedobacter sandarakinus]|uniref:Fic family protein n=1 Tax=Pedobacter sandarakinus TaxID=353156 RepID=UPI0022460815|nr:Fic family protein [Pedobacter sandarakinus]MCX2575078.1 Fic family protein [Pedobacter sandarakinus]